MKPDPKKQRAPYDHTAIEKKWQKYWASKKIFNAKDPGKTDAKKFYALIEFPFPSGDGLHVGHPRPYIAMDVIANKRRMQGYNVLYPIGWDAFGLPTENYAIKTGQQPSVVTQKNTDTFRRQIQSLGISFDWSREINTTDPAYYKWTQWIFLQFLKKGLAYKKKMFINWCPKDLIGLANEEVVDGKCERCGTPVEKREKEQWMLAITKYADRLDKDLDETDYILPAKMQQRNWIGKSEGAEITFKIIFEGGQQPGFIPVYTTRPDTLNGVTYMVLSPEHLWVTLATDKDHVGVLKNRDEVIAYIASLKGKTEIERTAADKEKTGIELKGVKAVNPATGEEIPLWIADYVLADYGTGAVMAVPAHDERDAAFAKKYNLPVKTVLEPLIIKTTGEDAFKTDMAVSERKAAVCIIKHWSEDKYLGVRWKKTGWQAFVVGGIEANESISDAAVREAQEETGYQNFEVEKAIKSPIHARFYQVLKNQNRFAHFYPVVMKLKDGEQKEITAEEKALHDLVWLTPKEMENFITHPDMKLAWEYGKGNMFFADDGILVNSGKFDGKESALIKKEITESVGGKWVTKFKLRDWVFSRQRYWGEPIPVVHCEKCGIVPLPEKELPLKLPKVDNYKPTETGESPLAAISKWVNTKCPNCKGKAKRETDTMPNWAGSSWYYLRYVDPKNKKAFASKEKLDYWTPVDWYNGGMEHTTLHLLYSRFWHKFLFDLGLVPTIEPYKKRTSHGLILAAGGEKMSKSKGNVVNPDTIVNTVGADALRLYEMFMGPFDQHIAWDENGIVGTRRFIEKVWKLRDKVEEKEAAQVRGLSERSDSEASYAGRRDGSFSEASLHKLIKKVSDDIENMRFNTAISAMMIAVNELEKQESVAVVDYETLLKLLSPFAPHVAEELWASLKNKKSILTSEWPVFDPTKIVESSIRIAVQVNGKSRGAFQATPEMGEQELQKMALSLPEIQKWLEGKEPKKIITVKGRLVNIVI